MGFGKSIPIDINNLIRTIPTKSDRTMLDERTGLKEQADMISSLESTVRDFEQAVVNAASDENIY